MAKEEIKRNLDEETDENEIIDEANIIENEEDEDEELSPEQQAILDELIKNYQDELNDLYERRHQRAIERASMTEEELEASMLADLEAVAQDVGLEYGDSVDEDYDEMSDEEVQALIDSIQGIGSLLTLDNVGTLQDQADDIVEQINKKKDKKDEE